MKIRCQRCYRVLKEYEQTTTHNGIEWCMDCTWNSVRKTDDDKKKYLGMVGIMPSEPIS